MQNPLRVEIKMPLARQRHSERSVGSRMVNKEATPSRSVGILPTSSIPNGRAMRPRSADSFRKIYRNAL